LQVRIEGGLSSFGEFLRVRLDGRRVQVLLGLQPQEVFLQGLIDLAQWQRDAILVIPTALLPVFFGDLLIEEAEPGHRAQLHHVDYY
jgi:hypothetical protein